MVAKTDPPVTSDGATTTPQPRVLKDAILNGNGPVTALTQIGPLDDSSSSPDTFTYPALSTPYKVLNQYHSKPTRIKVICIGAGAAGLCVVYKMKKDLVPGSWDLTIFEKNPTVGGTWYENAYPGVACDTPSALYTYSWDQNPDWSHYYAYGPEIHKYFEGFADREGCREFITFNTKVVGARWDAERGTWTVKVKNMETGEESEDWGHVLINASGILNNWQWPDVDGLETFAGPRMHSAKWDKSVDFKGKNVGVIGNGSTGIQIVPALAKEVKELSVFMRSPTYVAPPFGTGALVDDILGGKEMDTDKAQYSFSEEEKRRFREDPEYYLQFRKRLEAEFNDIIGIWVWGSEKSHATREVIKKEMMRRLGEGNEELKEFLLPKWAPGCRRISPGGGYLEALAQPHVHPVMGDISHINETGIVTADGKHHPVDILVCATGFRPAFRPAFDLFNADGTSLNEDWGESANMYLGVTTPRFPNFFTIAGPGSTWAAGSLLPSIEAGVEYTLKVVKKIQAENIREIEVRQDAVDDLMEHFDAFHKYTVFQDDCRSWYKDGKIKNRVYNWPGGTIHHIKSIMEPRYEDYKIKYRYRNRFAYLGNGEVKANMLKDIDGLSSYVRKSDHPWTIE